MAKDTFSIEDLDDFFKSDDMSIVKEIEEPAVEVEETPEEVEESAQEEEVEELKEEEVEENKEEENEEDYNIKLHQAFAKAISTKFGYDIDDTKIETLDDLSEVIDNLSTAIVEDKWETTKNANEKIKSVFDVLENGGDVKDLIKIFEEEIKVTEVDFTDTKQVKDFVRRYYTEELNFSKEKADRFISALEANDEEDELLSEAKDIQKKYDDKFTKEREAKVAKAKEVSEKREKIKTDNIKNIATFLHQKNIPQNRIKEVIDFAYTEAYSLGSERLTKLDVEILKRQQEPEKIVNLIEFLQDEEAYFKKRVSKETTKKTESNFSKIIANQITKKTGSVSDNSKVKKSTFTLDDFGIVTK